MRAARWLVAAFVLTAFSGCLGDPEPEPEVTVPEPPRPVHPALPDNITVTPLFPQGPGVVRFVANPSTNGTGLVGLNLSAHPDDWGGSQTEWYRMGLDVVPFGDVTRWAVFVFSAGELHTEALFVPRETTTDYELPIFRGVPAGGEGVRLSFVEQNGPQPYQVVLAMEGDGGLAMVPVPNPPFGSPPATLDSLLNRTGGTPPVLGNGTGMTHAAYVETMSPSLGMRMRAGDVVVEDRIPVDTRPLAPVMDMTVSAPTGLAGWIDMAAMYSAADAHGEWSGSLVADETHEFSGTVAFLGTQPSPAAPLPWFFGVGDTNATVTSTYTVLSITEGVTEALRFHQTTFGTPLATLLQRGEPLVTWSGGPTPSSTMDARAMSDDLVLQHDGRTTVYVDALAAQAAAAPSHG